MKPITRRGFLAAGVSLGVGVPFVLGGEGSASTGRVLPSRRPRPRPFVRPLTVPPVLTPYRRDASGDHYRIVQRAASAEILPGVRTTVWAYNGTFPGPTIVSRRGRPCSVTHVNRLPVPTVVHLHGGRTPPASDGYPLDFVHPAGRMPVHDHRHMGGDVRFGQRTYTYPLEQRAATLWYHDHRMDFTGPSVWRGLAGFHLVRDSEEDRLRLPSGPRELPLMITDRSFDADGSLRYPSLDPTLTGEPGVRSPYEAGVLGDVMLVNGVPWPVATVVGASYRLRLLNACNARRLDLRLDPSPDGGLTQIGSDGGLLAAPVRHQHFELAPAQRLDAVVDFSGYRPGTLVTLRNEFGEPGMDRILCFRVGSPVSDDFVLPERLSTVEDLRTADAAVTRTFRFRRGNVGHTTGWVIDGQPFGPDVVAAACRLGTTEIWRLTADFHHPVHLHLNPFQVLSRGLGSPLPSDAGWKDTIDLRPAEEAAIAIKFDGYPGKYVFHCHNLEHEDMAMMANFTTR
ncbi:multicopper oxidase family protein [Cryptosporangium phraense]|uniref:Multicopper oxidase family protein n=1 Tax=Cryptosporangium phraense TaxID=2593070 RepID=A0A545AVG4_9ACTN|nr:multicopper oxidase family protein [Cryptosporangium phraense]TQS45316.1 multicopper oxidase family protein [Cryptosporangium phraense]